MKKKPKKVSRKPVAPPPPPPPGAIRITGCTISGHSLDATFSQAVERLAEASSKHADALKEIAKAMQLPPIITVNR